MKTQNTKPKKDKPLFYTHRFSKLTSHITIREYQSDGWEIREVTIDEIQEVETHSWVEAQEWDHNDPEFWEDVFSQRPSWERD